LVLSKNLLSRLNMEFIQSIFDIQLWVTFIKSCVIPLQLLTNILINLGPRLLTFITQILEIINPLLDTFVQYFNLLIILQQKENEI